MNKKYLYLILPCISLIFGGLSGVLTVNSIEGWYSTLEKPAWNPPNWIFAPVWTLLYFMMGLAFALFLNAKTVSRRKDNGTIFFVIQFVLNIAWSFIFFNIRNIGFALFEIILMWIFIIVTTVEFFKVRKTAGYMMIPYILWVTFATFLNYTIWQMNR